MPNARVDDVELNYRVRGRMRGAGPAILFICGYSADNLYWNLQLEAFSRDFTVIVFDNRGIGWSSRGREAFAIERFARDAAGLLGALEIPHAHVVGHSMGGMIAQELALRHPQRVDRLVLAGTMARLPAAGRFAGPQWADILEKCGVEAFATTAMLRSYSQRFFEERWKDAVALRDVYVAHLRAIPLDPDMLRAQYEAILAHDTSTRLGEIRVPTLVVVGREDILAPPVLSEELARGIPGARLEVVEGAGHALNIEAAEVFNQTVAKFLLAPCR